VTNAQLGNAMALFSEVEGMAIEPAAGVAVASLARAVAAGDIARDAVVLLHVTGGGRSALPRDERPAAEPTLVVARGDLQTTALDRARSLLP
jgi:cysteate synthase